MKLKTKILIVSLGITMTSLILQTILFSRLSSDRIYEQAEEESYAKLENMQNEIYLYIKSIENGLIEIYNEKELIQDFKERMDIKQMRESHYRETYNLVTENFKTSDMIVSMYLYTKDHEIISTYRRAVTPKHKYAEDIYDTTEDMNAEQVKKYVDSSDSTMFVSSYYNPYRETDIIRFVLKIYNNRYINQKFGYLVCDVDSNVLRNIMKKYITRETEYMWLQPVHDRTAVTYGEIGRREKEEYENAVNELSAKDESGFLEKTYYYNKQVIFKVAQKGYQLDAYCLMPQSSLKENQKVLIQSLLLIVVVMGMVSILVTVIVSNTLTKPLAGLVKTMKKIQNGDTKLRAEISGQDEVREVSEGLNEMLDKIEELIGKEYEQQILINQAEYKALQTQINPHFLYNTLDTMGSIANLANCSQVSHLCQSLSGMFRYSLDMKNSFSTIARELGHLKNYIYVMDVRMNSEVQYFFEIDEMIMQKKLPKITLQPIVENSLLHGLKNKRGEKWIKIRIWQQEGDVIIEVEDNGVGTDADALNRKLQMNRKEDVEGGRSIGLSNINARVKMIYGETYGVSVRSEKGEGTTVTLKLCDIPDEEKRC